MKRVSSSIRPNACIAIGNITRAKATTRPRLGFELPRFFAHRLDAAKLQLLFEDVVEDLRGQHPIGPLPCSPSPDAAPPKAGALHVVESVGGEEAVPLLV